MQNITILTECNDDNVRAAIIAAVCEMLTVESNFVVNKMRRGSINSPVWNAISRQEILNNKF